MHFQHFLYGVIIGAIAIVASEMVFDYSLGDYLKDLAVALIRGTEAKVRAQIQRAEARYKAAVSKTKERTGAGAR